MKKLIFCTVLLASIAFAPKSFGQWESIRQEGEIGFSAGASHYFGDLNTRAKLNRPKPAASIFFRKNFGNYIAMRVSGNFAQLGYSDIYNTHNEYMHRRNLSFNTNVWELGLQGDFNFYRFMPGEPDFRFTPYVTFGVSFFNYDPYAYLDGQKYFLRPLGTEGQGSALYPNRKPYNSMAVCFPLTVGFKYSLNEDLNLFGELGYRFTSTDYLDDVSTTYAGVDAFPLIPQPDGTFAPSPAYRLQDRSDETGTPIGIKGRQRGNSTQKDAYIMLHFGVSLNLSSYKCPSPKNDKSSRFR